MSLRIFLVDDHDVVRRGVRDMLEAEADFEVVGEAGGVEEALNRISAANPDVAVLDVRLPDGNGVELCRELRSRHPSLACLMLTSFDDDEALFEAIMAGAAGYVLKQEIFLSEKTVKNYVSNFFPKMGMSRRTEAAVYAARQAERHEHGTDR